jgi:hypothetical protein
MRAILLLSILVGACSHHARPPVRRINKPVATAMPADRPLLMNAARAVAERHQLDITYIDAELGRITALSPVVTGAGGETRERWHYHVDSFSVAVHRFVEHRVGDHWRTSPYLAPGDDRRAELRHLDDIAAAVEMERPRQVAPTRPLMTGLSRAD